MKLYLVKTDTVITPFGDHVSEAQVLLEPLLEQQRRACGRHGVELVQVDSPAEAVERPCLVAPDYVYFTERALGEFLAKARQMPAGARLSLKRCASVEHLLPLQELELVDWDGPAAAALYDLWLVPPGVTLPQRAEELRTALSGLPPALVEPRELVFKVRLPALDEKQRYQKYPFTSTVCCHVFHWVHLLWLCQLGLGIAWNEYFRHHKVRAIAKALWAVLRRFSFNRHKVLAGMNVIGRGCEIHPTAYIEFSMLGRGVKVGAGCSIRNSIIGDGVEIADHAVVVNSVVGRDCFLTENFFLVSSLCYPGSTLGNLKTQMAVIGREVYLHGWCSLLDAKFVGDIKVMHRGKRVGTGRSFMASCIGHRAVLGAKVLIHPGRDIPNDLLMVSRPEDVIVEVPPDIPPRVPMVRDRGTLVPLEQLKSGDKAE